MNVRGNKVFWFFFNPHSTILLYDATVQPKMSLAIEQNFTIKKRIRLNNIVFGPFTERKKRRGTHDSQSVSTLTRARSFGIVRPDLSSKSLREFKGTSSKFVHNGKSTYSDPSQHNATHFFGAH